MAKKKTVDEKLSIKHVAISTILTVGVVEIFPNLLVMAMIWWQTKVLGDPNDWASFFGQTSYNLNDIMKVNYFAFGVGAMVALALIMGLLALVLDEWFYSHKLHNLKSVLILSASWSIGFYALDTLLGYFHIFNIESMYFGPRSILAGIIFIIPISIYFGRVIAGKIKGKGKK